MDMTLLPALVGFAFASSVTPGPNNMMLLASGANFGLRRSLPHMLGISLGHLVMVVLVGLGLITVFDRWPAAQTGLAIVSVAYLIWLAWKVANASAPEARGAGRPFTFLQAAGFQWVNPKAWYMAIYAITNFAPGNSLAAVAMVAVVFAMTNFPSITLWTVMGQQMRRFLTSPGRLKAFNWTMAGLLLLTMVPVVRELVQG